MSVKEFTDVCLFKNDVLKEHEQLTVFLFIGLSIEAKANYNKTRLQFKTDPRGGSSFGGSVLSLPQQYKLLGSHLFVCDGSENRKDFQVNEKISLHGVGFLGPFDGDTYFEVTVQIKNGKLTKNVFARKGKIFYFLFDEPITVEYCSTFGSSWNNSYDMFFWLEGTSNIPQYHVDNPVDESFQASGVQFHLNSHWNNENPLAQLLFKKI